MSLINYYNNYNNIYIKIYYTIIIIVEASQYNSVENNYVRI